ncbi:PAS domain-containing protein [Hyphomonas sp. WL0036]|uniref:methyl-accepting chemotaxis protein n=1 Tax=Hyphomonas sediminis TaxID=2866160 RepID=UPI001C7E5358|nr:methyl-accepting chemotaxis protein [Hyphomonas sediminis]MBY9065754.1 PAS domain-containing protein [Hyphomonas sediminis]
MFMQSSEKASCQDFLSALDQRMMRAEFSPEGKLVSANPLFQQISGVRESEIRGMHYGQIFSARPGDGPLDDVFRSAERSDARGAKLQVIVRKGQATWIEAIVVPVLSKSGAVRKYSLVAVNISVDEGRHQNLDGILSSIERSQAMIEFAPNGTILSANRNFLATMGYELPDIVGKHHSMFVDPVYAKSPEYRNLWDRLRNGEAQAGTHSRVTRQGHRIFLQASYNPVVDAAGNVVKVVKCGFDISAAENERLASIERQASTAARQMRIVDTLRTQLKMLADGNLTGNITESFGEEYEELKTDFNRALEQLRTTICHVVDNASSMQNEATEISRAADELSRRTESQAATLEETSAALEELTASVKLSAENAGKVHQSVDATHQNAEQSGVVVQDMVQAMREIEESSRQISQIISVIDEIAFQTNLLALNAGVEAARAGDAGRGFAVVASEVRALAQRSSEASRQIKQLISKSSQQVQKGSGLVNEAGEALSQIVTSVTGIAQLMSEIAATSREQATGLSEINSAVNQLDHVTQQNAAMVEESTSASHSMSSEASAMMKLVRRFSLGDGVAAPARATSAPEPAKRPTAAPLVPRAKAPAPVEAPANPPTVRPVRRAVSGAMAPAATSSWNSDDWQDF